ncbi:MAG: acetate--CoA ligase family protein [Armatimonadetes bacterium]|nr:acetate--CoA ligase family protein [Armatimonadota bacterium]
MNPGDLFKKAKEEGRTLLLEDETKEVLEAAGIPTTRCYRVATPEEAIKKAAEIGYPVVLKIASPKILHKSDTGGVALNLSTKEEVAGAFERLLATGRRYDSGAGVVLQKMARPGRELIAGITADRHFGPVIMLGLGGIFTEILQDTVYRLLPIADRDAQEMIASLKSYPLLTGYRGQEPVDLHALRQVLKKLSGLVEAYPEIKELDLNPLAGYAAGVMVLDARLILE